MSKNIVVTGCSFSFSVGSGTVTISSVASTKVKTGGKYAYKSPMNILVTNYTDGSTIASGTGSGTITGSSGKTTIEGSAAILEEDSCTVELTGVNPESSAPVSGVIVTVKISDAGQTEVRTV